MLTGQIADTAHAIQMAVAPVFLLTAAAALLGVLSTRLSRIVDRARALMALQPSAESVERHSIDGEIALLGRRRVLINRATSACVTAALLVCVMIALMFFGVLLQVSVGRIVAGLFIAAMTGFIIALLSFLREISIASDSVRIGT
jgi:MFS family permease